MNDREAETRERFTLIAKQIADCLAGPNGRYYQAGNQRKDIIEYVVENPVTPAKIKVKRQVTDDGWGYEWTRIHVIVPGSHISQSWLRKIPSKHDLAVVDVWSNNADLQPANMLETHKEHANIRIALEPADD